MPIKMDGDIGREMDKLGLKPFEGDADTMDYEVQTMTIGVDIRKTNRKGSLNL